MGLIKRQRALIRVARNYKQALAEGRDSVTDAIVQTWAEVTDQPWQHARDEVHHAAFLG